MQNSAPNDWTDRQHSHSRSVDHASDAMLGRVPEPSIATSDIMVLKATTAVFDGYADGPPIIYATHLRRGHIIHTVLRFTEH